MLGGYYRRSIKQNAIGVLKVEDSAHPATRMLGGSWPVVDEFYLFGTAPWDASRPKENIDVLFGNHIPMGFSRDRVHVLLSLDTEKTDITGFPDVVRGGDYPQAWSRTYGKGRSFYTSLGHRDDIWSNDPVFRAHVAGRHPLGARARELIMGRLAHRSGRRLLESPRSPGCGTSRPRAHQDLPAPGFHHLHLNSVNPEAAIVFYTTQFPSTSRAHLRRPAGAAIAEQRVGAVQQGRRATGHRSRQRRSGISAGTSPTCARASSAIRQRAVTLLPLYTGDAGGTVFVSSDTWPGSGGVLGPDPGRHRRRQGQGRHAGRRRGIRVPPWTRRCARRVPGQHAGRALQSRAHVPGPAVLRAALVPDAPERAAARRAPGQPVRTEANCRVERGPDKTFPALDWDGMYRTPSVTSTVFGDVSFFWYMNQSATPAAAARAAT